MINRSRLVCNLKSNKIISDLTNKFRPKRDFPVSHKYIHKVKWHADIKINCLGLYPRPQVDVIKTLQNLNNLWRHQLNYSKVILRSSPASIHKTHARSPTFIFSLYKDSIVHWFLQTSVIIERWAGNSPSQRVWEEASLTLFIFCFLENTNWTNRVSL